MKIDRKEFFAFDHFLHRPVKGGYFPQYRNGLSNLKAPTALAIHVLLGQETPHSIVTFATMPESGGRLWISFSMQIVACVTDYYRPWKVLASRKKGLEKTLEYILMISSCC